MAATPAQERDLSNPMARGPSGKADLEKVPFENKERTVRELGKNTLSGWASNVWRGLCYGRRIWYSLSVRQPESERQ
jgi:hypothetical protein